MLTSMIIFMSVIAFLMIFVLILMLRNNKVLKYRLQLLKDDILSYDKLPDYNTMVFKFWIPLKDKYWLN